MLDARSSYSESCLFFRESQVNCRCILNSTLPGVDSRMIPRQLVQSDTLHFFGSFNIIPCCHSLGTPCLIQQLFCSSVSPVIALSPPCLNVSLIIPSIPAALFLSAVTSFTVSSLLIFLISTCNLCNVLPSCFPQAYNLPSCKSKTNKLDLISLSFFLPLFGFFYRQSWPSPT